MDRDEFVDEIRADLRRKSTALASTRIITWMNWAQEFIADWHTYEEMRKNYTGETVDGTLRYGFPIRMKDIHSMVLDTESTESRKLTYVKARDLDRVVPRPEQNSEGKPRFYVDYGVNFELYRIPDDEYTLKLRCSVFPQEFTSSTQESDLLRKDQLICAVTTMIGFAKLKEIEYAQWWKSEMVKPLFDASITSDHSGEDWNPVMRGFSTASVPEGLDDYTANPLVNSVR